MVFMDYLTCKQAAYYTHIKTYMFANRIQTPTPVKIANMELNPALTQKLFTDKKSVSI